MPQTKDERRYIQMTISKDDNIENQNPDPRLEASIQRESVCMHQCLVDLMSTDSSTMKTYWTEAKPGLAKQARSPVLPIKTPSICGSASRGS